MVETATPQSTRERILEAGRKVIEQLGSRASMTEIATAAGVSRQTLYLLFGDRTSLLMALTLDISRSDHAMRAMIAALELPALPAFEQFFRSWIRGAMNIEPALRTYWREAEGDPELMLAVRRADQRFYGYYRQLFDGLKAEGALRPIWTAEEAADAAYATTMYGVFVGHLRNMRGWSREEIEERGMKVLRVTFLRERFARPPKQRVRRLRKKAREPSD
jgi:AcrR family transcriptional regulator